MTHTIVTSYRNSITAVETSTVVTGDVETNVEVTVAPAAAEQLAELPLTSANLKAFSMQWTGTDTLTIAVNATGSSAAALIRITSAGVVTLDTTTPFTDPTQGVGVGATARNAAECVAMFPENVTAFYFTSTLGGTFKMMSLSDTTP